jgi:hypothetical protein
MKFFTLWNYNQLIIIIIIIFGGIQSPSEPSQQLSHRIDKD